MHQFAEVYLDTIVKLVVVVNDIEKMGEVGD
jgi:hypothetical protein